MLTEHADIIEVNKLKNNLAARILNDHLLLSGSLWRNHQRNTREIQVNQQACCKLHLEKTWKTFRHGIKSRRQQYHRWNWWVWKVSCLTDIQKKYVKLFCIRLGVPEKDWYWPVIHLYFDDDLTVAWNVDLRTY